MFTYRGMYIYKVNLGLKGGFQLMQILDLLGMYFDAVVVEVENSLLFSDWLWPYCGARSGEYQAA